MKIIDINVQVGPSMAPVRFNAVPGLMVHMDKYRISAAVVSHTAAPMNPWVYNEEMTRIARESASRIMACHVLDPLLAEKSEPGSGTLAARLRTLRPAAIRMLPRTTNYPLNAFFCGHVLSVLNELRLPLLLGPEETPAFAEIPALASEYPDLPIVLLRQFFNCARAAAPLIEKLDNVYIDANVLIDAGFLDELVNDRGSRDKLLFGSGLPVHEPAGGLGMILYAQISDHDKENIMHANWERLQEGIRYDD
jgi:predicted TIM-barrel fold metal-dependent hydrolase